MKLERTPRERRPKTGEVLRATPEQEQPLEFDLQRVVDAVKELASPPPYRGDYEFLLALAGQEYFEQLRPTYKNTAAELHNSLGTERGVGSQTPARSKLLDPAAFAKKGLAHRPELPDRLLA